MLMQFLRTFVSPGDNVLALHVQEPSATFDPNTFLIHEETCKAKQVDFLAKVAPGTVSFQNYAIKRASTMRQSLRLDAAFQGIQADILFTCVSLLWFLYCRLKQTVVNEYLKGLPPTCSFLVMDMFGRIVLQRQGTSQQGSNHSLLRHPLSSSSEKSHFHKKRTASRLQNR
ncbi:hypothetical protein NC652_011776 [Populus alba x Populus x berolinensis]|nr:hypothetical protein NC652_011776 [Populus alba x Populus x berolinensis]